VAVEAAVSPSEPERAAIRPNSCVAMNVPCRVDASVTARRDGRGRGRTHVSPNTAEPLPRVEGVGDAWLVPAVANWA
jgi:hypothetical protein